MYHGKKFVVQQVQSVTCLGIGDAGSHFYAVNRPDVVRYQILILSIYPESRRKTVVAGGGFVAGGRDLNVRYSRSSTNPCDKIADFRRLLTLARDRVGNYTSPLPIIQNPSETTLF